MSRPADFVRAFKVQMGLEWQSGLSGGERVWMLVYPPDMEREMRATLPQLELAALEANHGWAQVDITDAFGRWLVRHRHAEAFFEDPSDLTPAIVDQFEAQLAERLRERLAEATDNDVIALVGIGSIFPFLRASSVINSIDDAAAGRLLVLFPGSHESANHAFRLLDARDGFNYRARVIDPQKDSA